MKYRSCYIICIALALALALSTQGQSLLTDGLVAYYPLDGDAVDASGNGNDGEVVGAVPASDRFGIPNKCYSFDGKSQYISAPASVLPTNQRTISVWFKANTTDNRPAILGYGTTCGNSFFLGLNHWGHNAYTVSTHCDVYTLKVPFTNAPVGKWCHWVVVMDESGMTFYLNGQQIGSRTGISTTIVAGSRLGLGTISSPQGTVPYADLNVGYLNGYLDDVRIYNRALSQTEVLALGKLEGDDVAAPLFTLKPTSQTINHGLTNPENNHAVALTSTVTPITNLPSLDIKMFPGLVLYGSADVKYDIQFKTDLSGESTWTSLTNVTLSDIQPYIYIDFGSQTNSQKFFRAVPQ